MFRLVVQRGKAPLEIIAVNQDESVIENRLGRYVVEHASNGDEYTSSDIDAIKEAQTERIGPSVVFIDSVSPLSDEDIVSRGGGVCKFCHSDQVDPGSLEMDDGYVSRTLECGVCQSTTVETYSLSGTED